jgi:hypothetical protein
VHLLQVSNIQVPLVLGKDIVDASESPLVLVMDDVTLTLHSHVSAVTVFRTLDSHLRYGCPANHKDQGRSLELSGPQWHSGGGERPDDTLSSSAGRPWLVIMYSKKLQMYFKV